MALLVQEMEEATWVFALEHTLTAYTTTPRRLTWIRTVMEMAAMGLAGKHVFRMSLVLPRRICWPERCTLMLGSLMMAKPRNSCLSTSISVDLTSDDKVAVTHTSALHLCIPRCDNGLVSATVSIP